MPQDVNRARPSATWLANEGARRIEEGFESYLRVYREVTRRAADRFVSRDWTEAITDAARRLDLYGERIKVLVAELRDLFGDRLGDRVAWAATKAVYSAQIVGRRDSELAQTFYNSVTRKVFATVGIDPDIEFLDTDFDARPVPARWPLFEGYAIEGPLDTLLQEILRKAGPPGDFRDVAADARSVARHLNRALPSPASRVEVLNAVFYRRKGAYVIGRMEIEGGWTPLVLALVNGEEGISVDAVLTDPDDVSILFSFTRSHFHVDLEPAHELVEFLGTLMPLKRVAELYISIGHHKHGKTLLYRDVMAHLAATAERFEVAPGTPGLVMVTFTMPGYDLVFKVIRDRFPPEKQITRGQVKQKYRLVFRHDRAGRLVEAQEFEHLRFDRRRFTPELLSELLEEAGRAVWIDGDSVVIDHAYVERRVVPLNLYVAEHDPNHAKPAVIDYGAAIEELAFTGVFPGDLLLKNFGVTRHGRVVFYDYDELTLLEEVNFRQIPPSRNIEDEMSDQPWFGVGSHDVFPEELRAFLGFGGDLRTDFEMSNAHLFTASFWRELQERLAAGEVIDIRPYPDHQRLHHRG